MERLHADTVDFIASSGQCRGYAGAAKGVDSWTSLPGGERHEIYTLSIYLQDHRADERSLTVYPGSHRNRTANEAAAKGHGGAALPLHPALGDAVLFDSRLQHRGQDRRHANFKRKLTPSHHTVLAFEFGRRNFFSAQYDRCFGMRTALVNNASMCRGRHAGACPEMHAAEDLRERPLPPLDAGLLDRHTEPWLTFK